MRIINIPIEPFEMRYTAQWYRWFPKALKANNVSFINILGQSLCDKVKIGVVLDVYNTHHYKFSQLKKIMKMFQENLIKDDDVFLFNDLWFPGIEALQYVRNMTKKKFKICGILHAGTWDRNDFTYKNGMRPWGKYLEQSWLSFFDKVFLGSEFHKKLILKHTPKVKAKLIVTGLPINYKEVNKFSKQKENIIVFPHRTDSEKQPELFDKLAKELKKEFPKWKFIKTIEVIKNKAEYYKLLGKSKISVSFAKQETFGYAMLESLANRCFVFVPNRLSYGTMPIYKNSYYTNYKDLKKKIIVKMKTVEVPNYKNDLFLFTPEIIIKKMIAGAGKK